MIQEDTNIVFANFWDRVTAYIVDGFLLGGLSLYLNYINITNYKSFLFFLSISLISILYKPYMESTYGATLGKMFLKIKVVGENNQLIDIKKSFLRSLITILLPIIYIPVYYFAFQNPEILNSEGLLDFSLKVNINYPLLSPITSLFSILFFIDLIMLAVDSTYKKSLKDFIAKTYVIKN